MSRTLITRRTLLRGAGAAIGLPFLEAMFPRTLLAAPAAKAPLRAAFFYIPVGMNMEAWRQPKTPGLPETLLPMKTLAGSIVHITGLQQKNAEGLGDGAGDHARDGSVYLTGMHPKKTDGKDINVGVSADQVIAQQIGGDTRFPSLELGTDGGAQSGNCDSGYSCAYSSNISWRTANQPNAKETNPRNLFIRLFGDPKARASEAELAREASYTRSILDMVNEDSKRLQRYLSEAKFPFPVARIDATQAQQMMRFDNTPSTFYVDRSGIVRYQITGGEAHGDSPARVSWFIDQLKK